jgi:hypothetical protein
MAPRALDLALKRVMPPIELGDGTLLFFSPGEGWSRGM